MCVDLLENTTLHNTEGYRVTPRLSDRVDHIIIDKKIIALLYKWLLHIYFTVFRFGDFISTSRNIIQVIGLMLPTHHCYVLLWKDPGFLSAYLHSFHDKHLHHGIQHNYIYMGSTLCIRATIQTSTPNPALHLGPCRRIPCMAIREVSP